MNLKLFNYAKNKVLKKKQDIANAIVFILNGTLVHSVNFGRGFYINDFNNSTNKKPDN